MVWGKQCARTSCESETNTGYRIVNTDLFLSVCSTLAKETNLNALVTWINIDRRPDTATLYISKDKNTIDVSITRQIRDITSFTTSRLKGAAVYLEPTQQAWNYGPLTQEVQLDSVSGLTTGQNSSTTNSDAPRDFDEAATPLFTPLDISGSYQYPSQQSGSAVSAEGSLQRTSSTTSTIREFFDKQVGSVSDGNRSLSASHFLVSSGEPQSGSASDAQPSPQPLSAAQTLVDLSEQQASDGQRSPSLSSVAHTLLGLSDKQIGSASDDHRSPLPLSAIPTLTTNCFSEQQSGSPTDNHRSLSSATLTTGSFRGSVSDGQRSPISATPTSA